MEVLTTKMVNIINDIQYYKNRIGEYQYIIDKNKSNQIQAEDEIERLKKEYGIERKRVDDNVGITERKISK